jgi:hypothetical protein
MSRKRTWPKYKRMRTVKVPREIRGTHDRHHRLPKSRGGQATPDNISVVPKDKHRLYNQLFGGDATPYEVARILNEVWISTNYRLEVRRVASTSD